MAVDSKNLIMFDRCGFDHDTALGAWKKERMVLSRWRAEMLVDTRFVETPLVRFEQGL